MWCKKCKKVIMFLIWFFWEKWNGNWNCLVWLPNKSILRRMSLLITVSNLKFTCLVVRYLYIKCWERSGSSIGPRVKFGVLVDYSNRGIEVYFSRSLSSRSLTDLKSWRRGSNSAKVAESTFGSWDWGVLPTIIVESVFNRLEIMASWFRLRKGCGVNPQPALDRGATSVLCGSWDWDVFSTIIAKSVFNRLNILESWDFLSSRCKLPSPSLTDLISWSRGTSFMVVVSC